MKNIVLPVILTLLNGVLFAQDDQSKWTPTIGLQSDMVPSYQIAGTDTSFTNKLSIAPTFALRNGAGWGIVYSPKFLPGTGGTQIFMHAVTMGVEQYDKRWADYSFNYNHYFFTGNKSVPYSPLNNEISGSLTWKKMWIRPMIEAGVGFGKDTTGGKNSYVDDIAMSLGAGHAFAVYKDSSFDISFTPALLLNMGTYDYFSFLNVSKYIGHGTKSLPFLKKAHSKHSGVNENKNNGSASSLSAGNIEARFEAYIDMGNWALRPDAAIYFPVGQYTGTGVYGYWQLTLTYNFY